jgi:serine phosphatase RsbU (regulator of sigma subunit)
MFVTLLYGVLDPKSGQFTFASAGHTSPIVCVRGSAPRYLRQSSLPLAAMAGTGYTEQTCALGPGDALVLVSDGLFEIGKEEGNPLGYKGLLRVVERARRSQPEFWLERIWGAVSELAGPERDDATMVIVQRQGAGRVDSGESAAQRDRVMSNT